jgi:hypothetical protein
MTRTCLHCGREFEAERGSMRLCSDECRHKRESAQAKVYYAANRERVLIRRKAHYEANRERTLAKVKAYHAANREIIAAKNRAYRKKNAERLRARRKQRRGVGSPGIGVADET